MAVVQMARGSQCEAFPGVEAWQTAGSKAGQTKRLWPKWLMEAAGFEAWQGGQGKIFKASKTVKPDGCGQTARGSRLTWQEPTFHTSGGPKRRPGRA